MQNEFRHYYAADGSNVGGAIAKICREAMEVQSRFLAEKGIDKETLSTMPQNERDILNAQYATWYKLNINH